MPRRYSEVPTETPHNRNLSSVLVSVNGSAADQDAVRLACELAHDSKARVYAIYVIEVRRSLPLDADLAQETARAEQVLTEAEHLAAALNCPIEAELLQAREVGPAIVDLAYERHADVLVMGIIYKRKFGEFTLGETIPYVMKNAPCQVCLTRQPESA